MPFGKILVVEDEPDILELICRYLTRCGHTVVFASTGAAAVELAKTESPQLVLTDKHLPDCLGDELIQRIRSGAQASAVKFTVKIVLITADIAENDDASLSKPDRTLFKPFALGQLGEIVDRLLVQQALEAA
jgi:two-component system, OmpR family, response regulator